MMVESVSSSDLDQILREEFTNEFRKGYTTVQGVCLPVRYEEFSREIENFEVREDDVWICSFPKTGTTFINFYRNLKRRRVLDFHLNDVNQEQRGRRK